ncbi:flagellar basal body rod C-terminal domain-containing protein [Desulfogranum japonicum]|uniref:flagellar basal body rod C-terminal domain-containing protein n=1 Tax=Desulfogranum japonicum TaxID=231447 RepID=UPI000422C6B7|nr:flagellar basal body rod C-terminal domain-containing protein [Desulfogranum japonicum]
MISGLNSALSGLQAVGTKVENNANNVANLNSDGFKKGRVILSERAPQGVKANFEKVNTPGSYQIEETNNGQEMVEKSNVDLGEEMPEMIMNKHTYSANLKTIETVDEMMGQLLNTKA